jgi:alanyl-tRNA synthetase
MTRALTSSEIRSRFLEFFKNRQHAILPSASLVPENDPSVLFNTAGMQPLVPYLLGQTHPMGTRLADIQKCVRTNDIDEVGDNTHLTFFEMMGNWSLGDYFKQDAIKWSYEFLTDEKIGLGLDPQRLYVTCFEGNADAPRDEESAAIWSKIFYDHKVTGERMYFRPAEKNWWSAGDNGPCGPDTEMFYDLTGTLDEGMTLEEYLKADDEQKVVEIWNDVFMEYVKKDGKVVGKLPAKNVDTGSGFERVVTVVQGKGNIFETDVFSDVMELIKDNADSYDVRLARIVADHLRTSTFLIADGVLPSNKDQGYILRRLIRRAIFYIMMLGLDTEIGARVIEWYTKKYSDVYPNLDTNYIRKIFREEEEKFRKTLTEGKKEFDRGTDAFTLWTSYGFPVELTTELSKQAGREVNYEEFKQKMKSHQELSSASSEQKFKGGMGGTGDAEVRYHTATHLLHQALRDVLGKDVGQKGSNITAERLRFDFTFPRKMTDEEKQRVEDIVNEKIAEKLPMQKVVMKKADAEKTGALHFFGDKYGDEVNVYYIGHDLETAYSKEFCGGPHVPNTGELGHFKIIKEEAVSAGVRRIKAILIS